MAQLGRSAPAGASRWPSHRPPAGPEHHSCLPGGFSSSSWRDAAGTPPGQKDVRELNETRHPGRTPAPAKDGEFLSPKVHDGGARGIMQRAGHTSTAANRQVLCPPSQAMSSGR